MRTIGETKIYHWNEIEEIFHGADIFLGNGFSININSALNYNSLFDRFLRYLDPDKRTIFKKFNSTNFEGIQYSLSNAAEVNVLFGHKTDELEAALTLLKSGLLNAIGDLHPAYSRTDPNIIFQLSQKLDYFQDIFTTNYDIFLYHITLTTLDRYRRNSTVKRYQDFFRKDGQDLAFTDKLIPGFKNVYYLHGALFLHKEKERTLKINRGTRSVELLDLIRLQVHIGYLPIFVSEGKAHLKVETISRNKYLSFCKSAFKGRHNRLVVHGFSFSDCDGHLLNDLNDSKRRLGIGLHLAGLSDEQILKKVKGIEGKLYRYRSNEIKYFDARTLF